MTNTFSKDAITQQDIADRITFRLHTASRLVQQLSQQKLKALELSQAQWRALSAICSQPGTTLQQLTAFAQISQPLMSQAVKSLEERALIERRTPERDKRSSVLNATDSGKALGQRAYAAMMEVETELKTILGESDATQLNTLLDAISDSLKKMGR